MKFYLVFTFFAVFHVMAGTVNSQERVSLNLKEVSLMTLFQEIQKQTGIDFVYNEEQCEDFGKVSVSVKNETVFKILEDVFKAGNFTYRYEGGIIMVKALGGDKPQVKNVIKAEGVVTDMEGNPLPGVTVMIDKTTIGVVTNVNGRFELNIPEGVVPYLRFSYIGMKTQHVKYTGVPLRIVLVEDVNEMNEVVITGYQNIKKENATGAYQVITAKDLERRYSTDVISSLEGILPGLVSYYTGLNEDAESNIMIRGISTFTDRTKPLVVVDGLPIEGSIETINPSDINTITVLKDAAAASIYGVRASNGVIVVTTKRAKSDKVDVNFSVDVTISDKQKYDNYGWVNAEQLIELEEKCYEATLQDEQYAAYLPIYATYYPAYINPIFRLLMQKDAGTLSEGDYNSQIDKLKKNNYLKEWSDAVLRNKLLQQYNLSFRVKGNRLTSSISLNFKHSNIGIVKERDHVLNLSYRGDIDVAKWLDVAVGINVNNSRSRKHADQLGYLLSPTSQRIYHTIYDENGEKAYYEMACPLDQASLSDASLGLKSEAYNLLDELEKNFTKTRNSNVRSFVHAEVKVLPSLTLSGQFQYEDITNNSETYLEKDSYDMRHIYNLFTSGGVHYCPDGGILTTTKSASDHYTFRGQANYSRIFKEKHAVEAIAGGEIRETNTRVVNNKILGYDDQTQTNMMNQVNLDKARNLSTSDLGSSFTNPYWIYSLAGGWSTSSVKHHYTSLYFTGNYTYDSRYSLSGSWRVDKTDLFGADPKYRGRPLWSVGLGWNMSNESFMKSVEWVNLLKVRASYGLTGNIDQSVSSFLTARIFNNTIVSGTKSAAVNTPPNDQLRWEKTASYNIGIDYGLFDHRLNGLLDVYYKYSTDLLSATDLDPSCGYTSLTINNGKALNKGVELALNAVVLKPAEAKGIGVNATLNLSYNKNEIKEITTDVTSGIEKLGWGNVRHVLQKGYPVNSIYAFRFAGFEKDTDNRTQLAWYKADESKSMEGIFSALEPEDVVFVGGLDPKYTASFIPEITYKGFSLTALLVYYGGHYMRVNTAAWRNRGSFLGYDSYAYVSSFDYWNDPESGLYMPQGVASSSMVIEAQGLPFVDQCVFPADFLKLRNIVLSYNLPKSICQKCKISSAKLRFQMNHVATWVKNKLDIDPEANNAWTGEHLNKTPKSYTVSLSVNF